MICKCKLCGRGGRPEAFKYPSRCLECNRAMTRESSRRRRERNWAMGLTTQGTPRLTKGEIHQKLCIGYTIGRDSAINYRANQRRWAEAAAGVWYGGR